MSHVLHFSTRIAAFGAACLMAFAVNGAVLLGADQMATDGALRQAATCATLNLALTSEVGSGSHHAA